MKASYKFHQNRDCEFFPCHKGVREDEFNCLFCYCPLYTLGKECGGNPKFLADGTKSCEECVAPHNGEAAYTFVLSKWEKIKDHVKK